MTSDKTTKNDLIEAIYRKSEFDKQLIQKIADFLLAEINENLSNGNSIELRGLGSFEPRLRKGRDNARNPKTGKILSVAPHYTVIFKPGKVLKENLSKLPVE